MPAFMDKKPIKINNALIVFFIASFSLIAVGAIALHLDIQR